MAHREAKLERQCPGSGAGLTGNCVEGFAAAGVVHDLGNFIQVAASAMNILSRSGRIHDSELEQIVDNARTSLARAGALVRQTLQEARTPPTKKEADIAACLSEIAALVRSGWDARFRLQIQIKDDLPSVACDPISLQSAVLNLLLNARNAMPNGGDIAIAATSQDGKVVLCVADKGGGMSEETVKRAFEPFFTTKAEGLGGMGLPMVRRFAREAGGDIKIESRIGVGTVAMLHLPASR